MGVRRACICELAFVCVCVGDPAYDTQQLGSSLALQWGCGAEAAHICAAAFGLHVPERGSRNFFCLLGMFLPQIPVKITTTTQNWENRKHHGNESLAKFMQIMSIADKKCRSLREWQRKCENELPSSATPGGNFRERERARERERESESESERETEEIERNREIYRERKTNKLGYAEDA